MALDPADIFLVNRKDGAEWKSYKISFKDLAREIGGEINVQLPEVGYAPLSEVDVAYVDDDNPGGSGKFASNPDINGSATNSMADITKFYFNAAQYQMIEAEKGEQYYVTNKNTGETALYTVKADPVLAGNLITVEVDFVDGGGSLTYGDIIQLTPALVTGGGGSINIGICPPGMESDGSGGCIWGTPPEYPAEGTLWYNPANGITYIWYCNDIGSDTNEGQWVDVRPSGSVGGGGGLSDAPSDGNLYGREDGAWVKVEGNIDVGVETITGTAPISVDTTTNPNTATSPNISISSATESAEGSIQIATVAEAKAGTVTTKAVTPSTSVPKDAANMTGAALIPGGGDAARPATPITGMLRYNNTASPAVIEYYDGIEWKALGRAGEGGGGSSWFGDPLGFLGSGSSAR